MVKYSIKIFARIRPTKKSIDVYEVGEEKDNTPSLSFIIPRLESGGHVNNKREVFSFRFNTIFDQQTKQHDVFEQVVQPVIENCLEGYNGTIFAYGQTGSGKTFTITGGAERYSDRGIIPRTLSYLFEQYQKSSDVVFTTHISYLEIYNETGFDLLDPKHEASKLEDLPRVSLYEDSEGGVSLKNLSLHQASNEEEALNWLFLGDTNRMIAETPMNMASTRSHCIFTIHISCRESGSHTVRKAKLHLVDLAGSERVSKSGVGGTLLTEAKYINLSLHYLEQVIVALSEKSRSHIPYRNSMMTSVLRDSLGGNCMTTMIATLSVEKRNIEESISTCRFAQRVALIKNEATLNEELDPKLMVARLQQQVADLKQEIVMATGEERTDELTNDEKMSVEQTVISYIKDVSSEARLILGPDMRKIQHGYCVMKRMILEKSHSVSPESCDKEKRIETPPTNHEEFIKLQDRLKQRDDEINVLLKMLKQERKKLAQTEALMKEGVVRSRPVTPILGRTSPIHGLLDDRGGVASPNDSRHDSVDTQGVSNVSVSSSNEDLIIGAKRNVIRAELSQARQEAFDMYRREISDNTVMEDHKKILKSKYGEAKLLGDKVNTTRLYINKLKTQIEKYRISQGLISGTVSSDEEEHIRKEMEIQKKKFKELYNQLKTLKTEIEHVQHLMEKCKVQLQRDFEIWWTQQTSSNGRHSTASSSQDSTLFRLPSSSSSSYRRHNVLSSSSSSNDTIESRPVSQTRWKHREPLKLVKPVSEQHDSSSSIPLTGDMRADADIIAFYKARQKLITRSQE